MRVSAEDLHAATYAAGRRMYEQARLDYLTACVARDDALSGDSLDTAPPWDDLSTEDQALQAASVSYIVETAIDVLPERD